MVLDFCYPVRQLKQSFDLQIAWNITAFLLLHENILTFLQITHLLGLCLPVSRLCRRDKICAVLHTNSSKCIYNLINVLPQTWPKVTGATLVTFVNILNTTDKTPNLSSFQVCFTRHQNLSSMLEEVPQNEILKILKQ